MYSINGKQLIRIKKSNCLRIKNYLIFFLIKYFYEICNKNIIQDDAYT